MMNRQLQIGLENRTDMRLSRQARSRSSRAHWWFVKMREVVADARDWPPTAPPATGGDAPATPSSSRGNRSAS